MSQNIKDWSFSALVALLIGGSMFLAVVDKEYRPSFANLANIGLKGYVDWKMLKSTKEEDVGSDNERK
jgi:hypothetical protein